jgi:hypothetical protein
MDFLKFRRGVGRATDAQTDSQEMQEHIVINHADEESGGMLGGSKSNRPIQSQKKTQNPPTEVRLNVTRFAPVNISVMHSLPITAVIVDDAIC